jgi:ribosome maturation factor RimP
MSLKDLVEKTVAGIILNTEVFLVEIQVNENKMRKKITVFLDSDAGIGIDECSGLSHEIGKELEELIDTAYILEVSSPGADAPLKLKRQYKKSVGRNVKVIKNDNSEIKGELISADDNTIEIQPETKKKVIPEKVSLLYDQIKETRILISFK